jgi:hypothetical protein
MQGTPGVLVGRAAPLQCQKNISFNDLSLLTMFREHIKY